MLALEKDGSRAAAVIYFANCLNRCRELYSCTTSEGNRELVFVIKSNHDKFGILGYNFLVKVKIIGIYS